MSQSLQLAVSELSEGHSEQGEGNYFVNNSNISSVSSYLFRQQIILVSTKIFRSLLLLYFKLFSKIFRSSMVSEQS